MKLIIIKIPGILRRIAQVINLFKITNLVNPPFLPAQDRERITLVLDLDETLVHFFYVKIYKYLINKLIQ